jgi:hypothetical protein
VLLVLLLLLEGLALEALVQQLLVVPWLLLPRVLELARWQGPCRCSRRRRAHHRPAW